MSSIPTTDAPKSSSRVPIKRYGESAHRIDDFVTVEEPLEIRLAWYESRTQLEKTISVTMRTPGHELDLAVGFLLGEGVIRSDSDVEAVEYCGPPSPDKQYQNVVRVRLSPDAEFESDSLDRHFYTSSSCGVCGKTSLEAVNVSVPERPTASFQIARDTLQQLPAQLREIQTDFRTTGGLHAAAAFDRDGAIVRVREDVGRHNAVDKLIGSYFQEDRTQLRAMGLLLSGRAGFELVQKAAVVGIPLVAAIGPPSSLAVELAIEQGMSLVGFLKPKGFNVYSGFGNGASNIVAGGGDS